MIGRWRLAARLARREVRRHWVRSALVVLIIALPVLGAQGAAIAWQSFRSLSGVDPFQGGDAALAGADDMIGFDPRIGAAPAPPDVTRTETGFRIADWVQGRPDRGVGPDDLVAVELVAHVAPGEAPAVQPGSDLGLLRGALPATRREVVIGQATAEATGLDVGDTLTALASRVDLEVTGVARRQGVDQAAAWVGPPVDGDDWVPDTVVRLRASGSTLVVAELFSLHWYAPGTGLSSLPPPGLGSPPDGTLPRVDRSHVEAAVVATAVTTMVVGFVAITCSSAFAIGARRQLRTLGTLAAAGASPGDLRRAVLLQGTILGAVGAALATVLVYVGRSVVVRTLLDGSSRWGLTYDEPGREWVVARAPGWVLGAAVLGVVAGTAAALVPAVTAGRIPVLSALAGRRPLRRHRARSPYLGATALAGGLALLSWSTAESGTTSRGVFTVLAVLLTMGGAVALAPAAATGIAGLASRAGRTPRLAGRSLVRNSMRTGAVVATTAVAVALPVVLLVGSANQDDGADDVPAAEREHVEAVEEAGRQVGQVTIAEGGAAQDVAVEEVLDTIGSDVVIADRLWVSHRGDTRQAFAVDPEQLRRIAGDDRVADALADGAIVRTAITGTGYSPGGPEVGVAGDPFDLGDRPVRTLGPQEVTPLALLLLDQARGGLIAGPAPAPEEGRPPRTVSVLRPGAFSDAERSTLYGIHDRDAEPTVAALRDLAAAPDLRTVQVDVAWSTSEDTSLTGWFVLGAVVFALVVIGTAMALAAADGRGDDAVVAAVGAPPGTVRRRRALEATMTAGAASGLALVVGVAATLVVTHNPGVDELGTEGPVRFPVLDVLGVTLGTVVVVGGATWIALALGARLRGRRDLVLVDG